MTEFRGLFEKFLDRTTKCISYPTNKIFSVIGAISTAIAKYCLIEPKIIYGIILGLVAEPSLITCVSELLTVQTLTCTTEHIANYPLQFISIGLIITACMNLMVSLLSNTKRSGDVESGDIESGDVESSFPQSKTFKPVDFTFICSCLALHVLASCADVFWYGKLFNLRYIYIGGPIVLCVVVVLSISHNLYRKKREKDIEPIIKWYNEYKAVFFTIDRLFSLKYPDITQFYKNIFAQTNIQLRSVTKISLKNISLFNYDFIINNQSSIPISLMFMLQLEGEEITSVIDVLLKFDITLERIALSVNPSLYEYLIKKVSIGDGRNNITITLCDESSNTHVKSDEKRKFITRTKSGCIGRTYKISDTNSFLMKLLAESLEKYNISVYDSECVV